MNFDLPKTVTIENVEYNVDELSDKAKQLLAIYQKWSQDTAEARMVLAKNEAALRDLTLELKQVVLTEKVENVEQAVPKKTRKTKSAA